MKVIEELDVFLYADKLTIDIYKITENFPKNEIFGLVGQIRRAAVSICSNLAEGGSRTTAGELKQFIGIARGSLAELKYQISLSKKLGFIESNLESDLINRAIIIHKMLTGLMSYVKK